MRRDATTWLGPLAGVTVALWLTMAFLVAPTERIMGDVQRIFYIHVPTAWGGMLAFAVVFVASIAFLAKRNPKWDHLAHAAAEVGVMLTSAALLTGMLWARPVWNTWWTWDPRLTSTLIMWFIYVAYLMLRSALDRGEQGPRLGAIYGIVAFLIVPLVWYSARLFSAIHPVIENPSTDLHPVMRQALWAGALAFVAVFAYLTAVRYRVFRLQAEVDMRKYEAVQQTAGYVEERS